MDYGGLEKPTRSASRPTSCLRSCPRSDAGAGSIQHTRRQRSDVNTERNIRQAPVQRLCKKQARNVCLCIVQIDRDSFGQSSSGIKHRLVYLVGKTSLISGFLQLEKLQWFVIVCFFSSFVFGWKSRPICNYLFLWLCM